MFYVFFFLISIVISLSCAFAWFSIGVFGIGIFFIVAAAISLFGMFYSAITVAKEAI